MHAKSPDFATTLKGCCTAPTKNPFARATLADGKDVAFYTLLPLHAAEIAFKRQHGPRALLERFAERNVPEYWDPKRPSAV